jgi:hypothetical protein
MRLLTPNEQRQIEQFRAEVVKMPDRRVDIIITLENQDDREKWLNILDIVLGANDAMKIAWRRSDNPNVDLVKLVESD